MTAFISIAVGILAEWNGDFDDNAQKPITQNQTFMVSLTRAQMPTGLLQFDTVQFVRDVDSAGTLEKVVADTVLQFRDSSGKMRSQTSIPFPRGVSSRWSALIAESPRSERGKPGSVRTTFAIDNADASLEQTIIVTVYDDQEIGRAHV